MTNEALLTQAIFVRTGAPGREVQHPSQGFAHVIVKRGALMLQRVHDGRWKLPRSGKLSANLRIVVTQQLALCRCALQSEWWCCLVHRRHLNRQRHTQNQLASGVNQTRSEG